MYINLNRIQIQMGIKTLFGYSQDILMYETFCVPAQNLISIYALDKFYYSRSFENENFSFVS